jgi:hypothetical protein
MIGSKSRQATAEDPSVRALKVLFDEMFYLATLRGEMHLLHRIFSH